LSYGYPYYGYGYYGYRPWWYYPYRYGYSPYVTFGFSFY
jgi:hypothetical protein